MTEFKETMYVHSFQVKQGYVVFNTLYGYLDLLSNDLYNKFKKGKYQEIDKNSLDILLDHRFIINNKLNEESLFNSYISLYEHNRNKEKNIYILFSYECNFNCTYCFEHDMKGKETSNNNLNKIFRYVEKQLENNKVRLVLYGGEPLLLQNYNKIEKVLSFAQKNNIKVKIITNGYLLDVFSKLLLKYKRNIDYLLITLDGDKDQHDLTRKKKNKEGTYKKIVENILMADKLKIKTKIRVNVGMENQKYIIAEGGLIEENGKVYQMLPWEKIILKTSSFMRGDYFKTCFCLVKLKEGHYLEKPNEEYATIAATRYGQDFINKKLTITGILNDLILTKKQSKDFIFSGFLLDDKTGMYVPDTLITGKAENIKVGKDNEKL